MISQIKPITSLTVIRSRLLLNMSLFSAVVLVGNVALASEIRVHDCDGNLRATTETQEGQTKGIKLALPTEESNAKAKLSKIDSDSVLENKAKDISLVFSSVESGDWKVCKQDGSLLAFNSVEFIEGSSESLRVASLVAGGAAVVSGIAIASGEGSNSDSTSGSTNLTEPSEPDRAVNEKPAESSQPQSALKPGSSSRPDGEVLVESRCGKKKPSTQALVDDDCREDEDAPIISPYN